MEKTNKMVASLLFHNFLINGTKVIKFKMLFIFKHQFKIWIIFFIIDFSKNPFNKVP
jgi:hypothetical protein